MEKNEAVALTPDEARITGGFWKEFMEKVRTHVIPYQWDALNDRIPDAEPSYCMRNFRVASGKEQGEFGGRVFQDSDFAKWIEAVAYSLMWHPDEELEKLADGAVDDVVAAQQADGYLNTYYIINGVDKRFTNLRDSHELYCLGHLLEGAIAYYQATGKDKLLRALIRYVDLVDRLIGPDEGKIRGYPGHQEIELALIKLYGITGDEKHLRMADYFISERGREPNYFVLEGEKYGHSFHWKDSLFQYDYYQAGKPVVEQQHAVGHAVRAAYMYSGMADVARLTGNEALMGACRRLWVDVTRRQMYITGGIGSSAYGEAFTFEYDLPNDTAYAETCASIALVFFAHRMLNIEPKDEYADVLEKALYNGVISGMSADGKSFFYANPLEAAPESVAKDQLRAHIDMERRSWFSCACCPPNLARLLASLGSYLFSMKKDTLYINLYAECSVNTALDSGRIRLDIATDYPWGDTITIKIHDAPPTAVIAVRIPSWCGNYIIKLDGREAGFEIIDGYAHITGFQSHEDSFPVEDSASITDGHSGVGNVSIGSDIVAIDDSTNAAIIELTLKMPVTVIEANPRVRGNIGKVAITRGPLVYCLEEVDNGSDLHRVFLQDDVEYHSRYDPGFLGGAVLIESQGKRLDQKSWDADTLYRKAGAAKFEDSSLTWIPYYLWANRGVGEMTVWVHKF